MHQRKILGLEVVHVTHELSLGVVAVEDRVGEVFGGTLQRLWNSRHIGDVCSELINVDSLGCESSENFLDLLLANSLVKRDSNVVVVNNSEVCEEELSSLGGESRGILLLDNNGVKSDGLANLIFATFSAMRLRPAGPWYTAYIADMLASNACAVQMLLVAFSRLMCCSRVCKARRAALSPSLSFERPMIRPGIFLLYASLTAKKAA